MLIIVGKLASCVAFNPEYNIYCYDHALFYNSSIIIMLHNIIVVHPSGFISGGLLHPPPLELAFPTFDMQVHPLGFGFTPFPGFCLHLSKINTA